MRADRLDLGELDALVVTNLVNVRYLTGYTGSNGVAVVGPDSRLFFTDFRYMTQAASEVSGFEVVRGERDLLGDVAEAVSGRVGFEDATLSVRRLSRLQGLVGDGVSLEPAGDLVEELRAVKEPGEVAALRAAAALADGALSKVLARGLVGRTEHEVAVDLEHTMRVLGASEPSFGSIVASGAHGALPHASPRDVEIPADVLVTIDWGAVVDGYCSDCTRTYATGSGVPGDALEVYELVRSVQASSVEAVRAGAHGQEVDALGRAVISDAGHGEHYGHGLGHGVGMEVHEGPNLSPRSEATLEAGNVVTVEPGVYVPGEFGVRIEDLVVVTSDGCDILSSLPKVLTVVD
ncbi:MAG: Xaa-Pro aminopeptidase [Thermoleophilaceae bacterium]|jgi:Xaa-Pro aminopeptidase|nr:Xaa-Pro aminopeptidase [Thermoleophilaceae bacterium]